MRRRYTVIGADCTYFVTELPDLVGVVRVALLPADEARPALCFSVMLANGGAADVEVFTSAFFNPLCRHQFAETNEDQWFKRIAVSGSRREGTEVDQAALNPFVVSVNEDVNRHRSITNYALVRRAASASPLVSEVCTSRLGYLGGPCRSLANAAFLATGSFEQQVDLTVFNDIAVVGDLHRTRLAAGESLRSDYVMTLHEDECGLAAASAKAVSPAQIDRAVAEQRSALNSAEHDLGMEISGSQLDGIEADTFNHFVPYLRKQVAVCAEVKGFMHPSPNSLIGVRDVCQAAEAYLYDQPGAAKRKLLEVLSFVLPDGRCPRQYSLPVEGRPCQADLREFIDQGCWVVSAVHTYVRSTGDAGILDDVRGYHRICPNADDAVEPAGETDTVIEHLLRIMAYLERHRDPATKLVRALYGDWNDALDGLGLTDDPERRFGDGVSVMASLQFYRNCTELIELLSCHCPRRFPEAIKQYRRVREELREGLLRFAVVERADDRRIVHGWGDGRKHLVGSFCDSDRCSRDGLTSNAFWVIAGMLGAAPDLRGHIQAAFQRLDSRYGLKTFEPGFAPNTPGVGRIPKLPIGTAENGGTYVHATAFAIMALFRMGEPEFAWEQVRRVLPFAPHHTDPSHSPFVICNSYINNPELGLTGQSMNDWQTGGSNVLLKTLIWDAFGFAPGFDALHISPACRQPFDGFTLRAKAHGKDVRLDYRQGTGKPRSICLNGVALIPVQKDRWTGAGTAAIEYESLSADCENVVTIRDP